MKVIISQHALQQMFKRAITVEELKDAILSGIIIKDYPADRPYPSKLVLIVRKGIPLHVVYAENKKTDEVIVITAYRPDEGLWNSEFTEKR